MYYHKCSMAYCTYTYIYYVVFYAYMQLSGVNWTRIDFSYTWLPWTLVDSFNPNPSYNILQYVIAMSSNIFLVPQIQCILLFPEMSYNSMGYLMTSQWVTISPYCPICLVYLFTPLNISVCPRHPTELRIVTHFSPMCSTLSQIIYACTYQYWDFPRYSRIFVMFWLVLNASIMKLVHCPPIIPGSLKVELFCVCSYIILMQATKRT